MKRFKEALFAVAFVLVAAALLYMCAGALRPPRDDFGAVWQPYLDEPENSLDYLYLGSSYAYCDVNPGLVYDASGLTGYVMAGPEQTLSTTYWYLREALKTQSPKFVLIEATALGFERYQNYTQVNIDYMPLSLNRLGATFRSAESELRTGLVFPLYFYHGRWKEPFLERGEPAPAPEPGSAPLSVTVSAPKPELEPEKSKGYTAVTGADSGISKGPFTRELPDEGVYQTNLEALGDVLELCRRAGAKPVIVLHPTYSRFPEEARERMRADVAALDPEALFFDWSAEIDSVGIEPALHFYDAGHLNLEGAAIFSAWLGRFLADGLGASPQAQPPENAEAWRSAADCWQARLPDEKRAD